MFGLKARLSNSGGAVLHGGFVQPEVTYHLFSTYKNALARAPWLVEEVWVLEWAHVSLRRGA